MYPDRREVSLAEDEEGAGSNYPGGRPNPARLGFIQLSHLAVPSVDQTQAIRFVAEQLGRPVVYTDGQGHEREIIGAAAADGGRKMAWVEGRSKSVGKVMDVEFVLHASTSGVDLPSWTVETYNPYFGCEVGYIGWSGEQVVVLYVEKHKTLLAVVGPSASPRLCPIGPEWWLAGDVVHFSSESEEELVEGVRIPDLTRMTPLATPAMSRMKGPLCVPVPKNVPRFQTELRRELFGDDAPQPEADLVMGALAHRFWDRWPEVTDAYPHGLSNPWNSPRWLPFYWYLASQGNGAERLLTLLDSLAERAEREAPTSAVSAAVDYVSGRSRILAAACRAGALPDGTWCGFWVDWSLTAFLPYVDSFPRGFRDALEVLRRHEERWQKLSRS
jgi:hypothetical protein